MNRTLTAVAGLTVGHWTASEARTGCTVVLCPEGGCLASGLVLGSAPGSRESALLAPEKTVERVDAVLLTGGSAFGLAAADGVMRWLESRGRGFPTPYGPIPIVPTAVLFDLGVGRPDVRPDAEAGFAAAEAASADPVQEGPFGAGTGATVGKFRGFERASPSGVGSAALTLGGATVAALAVSNAAGSLVDPDSGELVAGPELFSTEEPDALTLPEGTNTSLAVVATDAPISKAAARALAQAAHFGIARVTRPSHTTAEGDTTFVLSTGRGPALPLGGLSGLSVAVQQVVAEALLRGARAAA